MCPVGPLYCGCVCTSWVSSENLFFGENWVGNVIFREDLHCIQACVSAIPHVQLQRTRSAMADRHTRSVHSIVKISFYSIIQSQFSLDSGAHSAILRVIHVPCMGAGSGRLPLILLMWCIDWTDTTFTCVTQHQKTESVSFTTTMTGTITTTTAIARIAHKRVYTDFQNKMNTQS